MKFSEINRNGLTPLTTDQKRACLYADQKRKCVLKMLRDHMEEETKLDQRTILIIHLINQLIFGEEIKENLDKQVMQLAIDLETLSKFFLALSKNYQAEQVED